jgi:acyl-CoA thioester hydrolase
VTSWTAPVRYAEMDGQGVVFNSHYLLYCDEAMSLFCRERGLLDLAERVRLKASSLTWTSGATWGETISVLASCTEVGQSSFAMSFEVTAGERLCCSVRTSYVRTDENGRPTPLGPRERERLQRAG